MLTIIILASIDQRTFAAIRCLGVQVVPFKWGETLTWRHFSIFDDSSADIFIGLKYFEGRVSRFLV